MARAGFRYVLNYTAWYGDAEEVRAYADEAEAAGIRLIWPLNHRVWRNGNSLVDHYRFLGPDCGCSSNHAFKQFALGLVKDHPATWGFYIGDEVVPSAENVSQVAALASDVEQIAPGEPTLYITLPLNDLEQQLDPFAPLADVAGADYYPVGLRPDLLGVPSVAETVREVTARHGVESAIVLQAFSWSQYQPGGSELFPTRSQMLQMRDLAIAHGEPQMILWYAYNDLMEMSQPLEHWTDLRSAAFTPHIRLGGVGSRCSAARVRPRVEVRTQSALQSVSVELDGRAVLRTSRDRFKVTLKTARLRRGRHELRVSAVDLSGRSATAATTFRRCRVPLRGSRRGRVAASSPAPS